jgi:hypothetical protein
MALLSMGNTRVNKVRQESQCAGWSRANGEIGGFFLTCRVSLPQVKNEPKEPSSREEPICRQLDHRDGRRKSDIQDHKCRGGKETLSAAMEGEKGTPDSSRRDEGKNQNQRSARKGH